MPCMRVNLFVCFTFDSIDPTERIQRERIIFGYSAPRALPMGGGSWDTRCRAVLPKYVSL